MYCTISHTREEGNGSVRLVGCVSVIRLHADERLMMADTVLNSEDELLGTGSGQ